MEVYYETVVSLLSALGLHESELLDEPIFGLGILLLVGFFGGQLANKVRLPSICGYIGAGILCGPYAIGLVSHTVAEDLEPIPHIALGLIALTIGGHFNMVKLRRLGSAAIVITLAQLLATMLAVLGGLLLVGVAMEVAILLSAIAAATAPAATMAVVNEYRAKGSMIDMLLATVALDDAGCIILFSLAMTASGMMTTGLVSGQLLWTVLAPLHHILTSCILGLLIGWMVHRLVVDRRNNNEIVVIILGFVFLVSAVTMSFHLSPLLANMMIGFTLVNLATKNERILSLMGPVEAPVYSAFFAIAGAELNLGALRAAGIVGLVFILTRFFGKYFGAYLGAVFCRSSKEITKYLGLCLFPQAGVAIGLMVLALNLDGLTDAQKQVIELVVLTSVLVSELIGPPLSKFAIFRSGEAYKDAGRMGR